MQTVVGVNSWVAHHNQAIFGDDAHKFRPERWLDTPTEQLQAMERYLMPFGMGSRTCIGKNISLLEMSKLVPELVRYFDFDLGEKRTLVANNNWFVKPIGFEVKVHLRDENTA